MPRVHDPQSSSKRCGYAADYRTSQYQRLPQQQAKEPYWPGTELTTAVSSTSTSAGASSSISPLSSSSVGCTTRHTEDASNVLILPSSTKESTDTTTAKAQPTNCCTATTVSMECDNLDFCSPSDAKSDNNSGNKQQNKIQTAAQPTTTAEELPIPNANTATPVRPETESVIVQTPVQTIEVDSKSHSTQSLPLPKSFISKRRRKKKKADKRSLAQQINDDDVKQLSVSNNRETEKESPTTDKCESSNTTSKSSGVGKKTTLELIAQLEEQVISENASTPAIPDTDPKHDEEKKKRITFLIDSLRNLVNGKNDPSCLVENAEAVEETKDGAGIKLVPVKGHPTSGLVKPQVLVRPDKTLTNAKSVSQAQKLDSPDNKEQELQKMKQELEQLKRDRSNSDKELTEMKHHFGNLILERARQDEYIRRYDMAFQVTNQQLQKLDDRIIHNDKEFFAVREELEKSRIERSAENKHFQKLKQEVESLRMERQKHQKVTERYDKEILMMKQEVKKLEDLIILSDKEFRELKDEAESYRNEHSQQEERMKSMVQRYENEMKSMKSKYESQLQSIFMQQQQLMQSSLHQMKDQYTKQLDSLMHNPSVPNNTKIAIMNTRIRALNNAQNRKAGSQTTHRTPNQNSTQQQLKSNNHHSSSSDTTTTTATTAKVNNESARKNISMLYGTQPLDSVIGDSNRKPASSSSDHGQLMNNTGAENVPYNNNDDTSKMQGGIVKDVAYGFEMKSNGCNDSSAAGNKSTASRASSKKRRHSATTLATPSVAGAGSTTTTSDLTSIPGNNLLKKKRRRLKDLIPSYDLLLRESYAGVQRPLTAASSTAAVAVTAPNSLPVVTSRSKSRARKSSTKRGVVRQLLPSSVLLTATGGSTAASSSGGGSRGRGRGRASASATTPKRRQRVITIHTP